MFTQDKSWIVDGCIKYPQLMLEEKIIYTYRLNKLFLTLRLNAFFKGTLHFSYIFLAHLTRRLICELIVYPWSGVRPSSSTISKIFSSETAWLIKAKFYVEPHWIEERKFVDGILVTLPRWPQHPYISRKMRKPTFCICENPRS